jgi:hypothetical protein
MKKILTVFLVASSLFLISSSEQSMAKELGTDRIFVISRFFPSQIFIPASQISNKPANELIKESVMTANSLSQLSKLSEIDSITSIMIEKKKDAGSKQLFNIWGVSNDFFKFFDLSKNSFKAKGSILVAKSSFEKNNWKSGSPLELISEFYGAPKVKALADSVDLEAHPILKKFENLALMDLNDLQSEGTGVPNPRILIRIKPQIDIAQAKEKIQAFLNTATPAIKGSELRIKSLDDAKF